MLIPVLIAFTVGQDRQQEAGHDNHSQEHALQDQGEQVQGQGVPDRLSRVSD